MKRSISEKTLTMCCKGLGDRAFDKGLRSFLSSFVGCHNNSVVHPKPLNTGVRQYGKPLRRGKSIMLTHEDTLTRVKAYALTGEYTAHADKNNMLTQEIRRSPGEKLRSHGKAAYPLTWGNNSAHAQGEKKYYFSSFLIL